MSDAPVVTDETLQPDREIVLDESPNGQRGKVGEVRGHHKMDEPQPPEQPLPTITPIVPAGELRRPAIWRRLRRLAVEIEFPSVAFRLTGCFVFIGIVALFATYHYDLPGWLIAIISTLISWAAWRQLETIVQTYKIRQYTIQSISRNSDSGVSYEKALALIFGLRNYKVTLVDLYDIASSIDAKFGSTAVPSSIATMLAKAVRDQVEEALAVATIGLEQSIQLAAGRAKRTYRGALIITLGAVGVPVVAALAYAGALHGLEPEAAHSILGNWHVLAFATGTATMFLSAAALLFRAFERHNGRLIAFKERLRFFNGLQIASALDGLLSGKNLKEYRTPSLEALIRTLQDRSVYDMALINSRNAQDGESSVSVPEKALAETAETLRKPKE